MCMCINVDVCHRYESNFSEATIKLGSIFWGRRCRWYVTESETKTGPEMTISENGEPPYDAT